jgi:anti-sigma factor RsiW
LNCDSVIRELSNYIDGGLEPLLKQELEQHLGECEDCNVVVVQTKKSIEILCGCEPIPLSNDLRARLHAALRNKMAKKPD